MRDFFKQELETLYAKTQLRQYETLSAMDDPQKQIKVLLDTLEWACNQYLYIPEATKQAIISQRMLTDQKFIGFNAPILIKWFEEVKGQYFKEMAHEHEAPTAPPVLYEELKPETKQAVDNLLKMLSEEGNGLKVVPTVSQAEIDAIKIEDLEQREGIQPVSIGVPLTTKEQAAEKELRLQWMRECFDPLTGKPSQKWVSFEEWLNR